MPDYYDDGEDSMKPEGSSEPMEKDEMEPTSALVPKAFFAGKENLQVGNREEVEIVRLMDDEAEIRCVSNYDNEETPKEKEPVLESGDMMD